MSTVLWKINVKPMWCDITHSLSLDKQFRREGEKHFTMDRGKNWVSQAHSFPVHINAKENKILLCLLFFFKMRVQQDKGCDSEHLSLCGFGLPYSTA